MNYDLEETPLTRYALSGLLGGILAIMFNFILAITFRLITGFSSFSVINVSTIIFGSVIPVTVGGIILYFFKKVKRGILLHIVIFVALTTFLVFAALRSHLSDVPATELRFHELFIGVITIIGLSTAFLVPFLVKSGKLTAGII